MAGAALGLSAALALTLMAAGCGSTSDYAADATVSCVKGLPELDNIFLKNHERVIIYICNRALGISREEKSIRASVNFFLIENIASQIYI